MGAPPQSRSDVRKGALEPLAADHDVFGGPLSDIEAFHNVRGILASALEAFRRSSHARRRIGASSGMGEYDPSRRYSE